MGFQLGEPGPVDSIHNVMKNLDSNLDINTKRSLYLLEKNSKYNNDDDELYPEKETQKSCGLNEQIFLKDDMDEELTKLKSKIENNEIIPFNVVKVSRKNIHEPKKPDRDMFENV